MQPVWRLRVGWLYRLAAHRRDRTRSDMWIGSSVIGGYGDTDESSDHVIVGVARAADLVEFNQSYKLVELS